LLIPVLAFAAACAAPGATTRPTGAATNRPATSGPTTGATSAPTTAATSHASPGALPTTPSSAAPSVVPATEVCGPVDAMPLKNPGRLTLSTDLPAFGPWFEGDGKQQYPNEPEGGSPWSEPEFSGEPYSGEGVEAATAYAVADAMGFSADQVDWIANAEFALAFAPGAKPFDFHMAQIAITDERAQAVTFSDPYFDSNQSVLTVTPNDITAATSIEALKDFRLGAAANSTSFDFLENVIAPNVEPSLFSDNKDARQALKGNTVDGIIVDLLTAFFMRDVQLNDAVIVGQFGPPAEPDHVGFVLELDNPLVTCVNAAIAEIKATGTHQTILDQWITTGENIPFLE
jgi:polar amino acid transport system substrate-binding protein